MRKNYYDDENEYMNYAETDNYDDSYDSYDDESYPDEYDKPKYKLDSEYSQSDYDDDYDDLKSEDDYDTDTSLDESVRNELEKELDELDKSNIVLDDEEFDYDSGAIPSINKPKRKRRKKGEKVEKLDMSGSAVRDRFFQIMEDYHSGNSVKQKDALERAMKELEGFIHLIINLIH